MQKKHKVLIGGVLTLVLVGAFTFSQGEYLQGKFRPAQNINVGSTIGSVNTTSMLEYTQDFHDAITFNNSTSYVQQARRITGNIAHKTYTAQSSSGDFDALAETYDDMLALQEEINGKVDTIEGYITSLSTRPAAASTREEIEDLLSVALSSEEYEEIQGHIETVTEIYDDSYRSDGDLRIQTISARIEGNLLSFEIDVLNSTQTSATSVRNMNTQDLYFWGNLWQPDGGGVQFEHTEAVNTYIAPGSTSTLVTVEIPLSGYSDWVESFESGESVSLDVQVSLDSNQEERETDESNNSKTATFTQNQILSY